MKPERLKLDRMTKTELDAYYRHLDNVVILRSNIYTEREEGRWEGREEERMANARKMKMKGLDNQLISDITGLTIDG